MKRQPRMCRAGDGHGWRWPFYFVSAHPWGPEEFLMVGGHLEAWSVEEIERTYGAVTWYDLTEQDPA